MGWNNSIDIWSVGVLVRYISYQLVYILTDNLKVADLILGKQLFPIDNDWDHLALLIAYLGPPPMDFLHRNGASWKYFTKDG